MVLIANSNNISVAQLTIDTTPEGGKVLDLSLIDTFKLFQKPVLRVQYDFAKQRVIAGGLDCQLKFFELTRKEGGSGTNDTTMVNESGDLKDLGVGMRLQYKIKLPQAIFTFGISRDGQHYAVGLINGSLLIRSKQLEAFEEEQDEELKFVLNAFKPSFTSKAKGYKYFYRGQYSTMPDPEDVIMGMTQKKKRLQPFEQSLKKFQFREALDTAIDQSNPEVTLSLLEELAARGANSLEIALANRGPLELEKLCKFIAWKVSDSKYQHVLLQVLRFLVDLYGPVLGSGQAPAIDSLVGEELRERLGAEVELQESLGELRG
mmetsp:Transcript_16430/g.27849  ORF Transcript_16430/g.27849 Transcript_16430/m.27849 type:complete len:319 (-) Transcript_16430:35-991(-)